MSFPKGFASRLLPGRLYGRLAGWVRLRARPRPQRVATNKALGLRLPAPHSCHRGPGLGEGPSITARRPQSRASGNLLLPLPRELSAASTDRPGIVTQGHSRIPYFKDFPLGKALRGSPALQPQQRKTNGREAEARAQGAGPQQVRGGWQVRAHGEGLLHCPRAYLRSAAHAARFLLSTSWSRCPFTFPALRAPAQSGSSLSRAPSDPRPARALGPRPPEGCSAGASSPCS